MKRLVEARVLCPGDVLITSMGDRMIVRAVRVDGERVWLRLKEPLNKHPDAAAHRPFSVPLTTRFMREDGS